MIYLDNIILNKSFQFSVSSVKYYRKSIKNIESILLNQYLRSATSIGANVREAQHAQSKKDFISKMSIALKEANESEYWLKLLKESSNNSYNCNDIDNLLKECTEINKILFSLIKTSKKFVNDRI